MSAIDSVVRWRARVAAGYPVTMINPVVTAPSLVEFMGKLGFDSIMIDCEQGSADMERVEEMARAAKLGGMCAIARVQSPAPWMVERTMFRGVQGIVVPRLDSVADAKEVLDNVQYCFPKSYRDKIVIVQVETLGMVADLDRVLQMDGIDAYFIGPVDLAKAMGHKGDYSQPEVMQAMEDIAKRVRAAGKAVGSMVTPDDAAYWVARGVNVLYAHATDMLGVAAAMFLKAANLGDRAVDPESLRIWAA